jgi:DNA repair photolyase
MGTATDPYQHCEGRYRLTRGILSALADFANPLSILTKSTLILRDLDELLRLDRAAGVTVSMSVGTLDEAVRRVVEPGTPPGGRRLEILSRFAAAGIRTGVLVAPILPGLTDDEEHLDEVLAACAAAGVRSATPIVLHVRPSIREHFMPWFKQAYPWLYPHYVNLYRGRSYAPKAYVTEVRERFARLRLRHGLAPSEGRPMAASATTSGHGRAVGLPAADAQEPAGQLVLAL